MIARTPPTWRDCLGHGTVVGLHTHCEDPLTHVLLHREAERTSGACSVRAFPRLVACCFRDPHFGRATFSVVPRPGPRHSGALPWPPCPQLPRREQSRLHVGMVSFSASLQRFSGRGGRRSPSCPGRKTQHQPGSVLSGRVRADGTARSEAWNCSCGGANSLDTLTCRSCNWAPSNSLKAGGVGDSVHVRGAKSRVKAHGNVDQRSGARLGSNGQGWQNDQGCKRDAGQRAQRDCDDEVGASLSPHGHKRYRPAGTVSGLLLQFSGFGRSVD